MFKKRIGGRFAAGILVAALLTTHDRAAAQEAAPQGVDLAEFAARRHPQPVRVGDLINRAVLQPLESRPIIGHVSEVVRQGDGIHKIVMRIGGWFGFGGRRIAVPIDAMVLLGDELEVLDFSPQQLQTFPTYEGSGYTTLTSSEFVRMGLAHPSH